MRSLLEFIRGALAAGLRTNTSPLASRLRQRMYRTSCFIDTDVIITVPAHFGADTGCALYHASYVLNTNGRVTLGRNSHLGAFCYVNAHHGTVSIGNDVAVGPGSKLIAYSNHYGPGSLVTQQRMTADIRIGNNVFIGADCTILPGAVIGDNIVVAAGSVVKGELTEEGVYGGAPARQLRGAWFR